MNLPDGSGDEAKPFSNNARAENRESLFLGVDITRAGSHASGRIRNISATGALIEADCTLVIGDQVTLAFRGVDTIGAKVVRKTLRGAGVRFDRDIDPSACRQSVTSAPEDRPTWLVRPAMISTPSTPGRLRR